MSTAKLPPPATAAAQPRRLSGADVEETLERIFAAPAVDAGQVPMNAAIRVDSGEMRLALAVLEDALRCVLRHHGSRIAEQRHAARDALAWLESDDDSPPFTFVSVCQLFDLDPDWIRCAVRRRIERVRAHAGRDDRARDAA